MFFEDKQQNHARSKVPKFDYFDSNLLNFSSLFLIRKFVRQNKGRYFAVTRNEQSHSIDVNGLFDVNKNKYIQWIFYYFSEWFCNLKSTFV